MQAYVHSDRDFESDALWYRQPMERFQNRFDVDKTSCSTHYSSSVLDPLQNLIINYVNIRVWSAVTIVSSIAWAQSSMA